MNFSEELNPTCYHKRARNNRWPVQYTGSDSHNKSFAISWKAESKSWCQQSPMCSKNGKLLGNRLSLRGYQNIKEDLCILYIEKHGIHKDFNERCLYLHPNNLEENERFLVQHNLACLLKSVNGPLALPVSIKELDNTCRAWAWKSVSGSLCVATSITETFENQ